ncbi:MAG: membrane protein insertase YidC [Rhodothermales bacterium]|nr:membrane protein insertase YidC [Rhodothermales bacterium]
MDRNVVTATVLIALIMVVWMIWLTPEPPQQPTGTAADSTLTELQVDPDSQDTTPVGPDVTGAPPRIGTVPPLAEGDTAFVPTATGAARTITVRHDLFTAVLSTQGGTFRSFELTEYTKAESDLPVQLIDTTKTGAVGVVFTSPNNRVYDTRAFRFETDSPPVVEIGDADKDVVFTANVGDGALELRYTFQPGDYEVGLQIVKRNADSFTTRDGYELVWNGGIPFAEDNIDQSSQRTGAYARSGGEVENISLTGDAYVEQTLRGVVDWIAVKNKYFTVAILPDGETRGAELIGERFGDVGESYLRHDYVASLILPAVSDGTDSFRMYMGPIKYNRLNDYGAELYDMVDYGWDFFEAITRPLAKFVFIPIFNLLGGILPNYGLVIIVLAFLIKIVVYPLTKTSFKSMARMKELQPRMEAIKEKFPDDPQKQQQAMMKMYKETGVNPLGGCLPMLLQYPIIIALWQFLPQAIEIRQQGFLWAADLSAPDVILRLPFDIPFYGDFVAGFTLLMGISMVVQMRIQMNPGSNPQAKIFTYVMPIMIFVIFNGLAAGLNLYYLCYNVLTAAQQRMINKQIEAEKDGDENGDKADGRRASGKGRRKSGGKSGGKAGGRKKGRK